MMKLTSPIILLAVLAPGLSGQDAPVATVAGPAFVAFHNDLRTHRDFRLARSLPLTGDKTYVAYFSPEDNGRNIAIRDLHCDFGPDARVFNCRRGAEGAIVVSSMRVRTEWLEDGRLKQYDKFVLSAGLGPASGSREESFAVADCDLRDGY